MEIRVNRFLSQAGLGSRRAVEQLVREGRVEVNGEVLAELGRTIDPDRDEVWVDGRRATLRRPERTLLLHKPVGVVCSFAQQDRRPCLRTLLGPEVFEEGRLFHVGRLDTDSSGLLLLSDDGDLAQRLQRPRGRVWKTYRVEIDRGLGVEELEALRAGRISLDGRACLPARIRALDAEARLLEFAIHEGRNRQIRRMVKAVGAEVRSLHRLQIGSLDLGDLPVGRWRRARPEELEGLRREAGLSPRDDQASRE